MSHTRVKGRPELYTAYAQDMAFLNTRPKQVGVFLIVIFAALLPMMVADDLLKVLGTGLVLAIGAIGLNLLTGFAGQVSLGHAFFVAVGAYTASWMAGDPDGRTMGLGITFAPAWILGAGVMAAIAGAIVAPLAVRLRGLYLAVVTLGLVIIGGFIFTEWASLSGGAQQGREAPVPVIMGADLTVSGAYTKEQKLFWFFLVVLVVFAMLARNVGRSKIGRAFSAVRDRDIAAGVMGVELTKYKLIAFVLSSFYAGVCGSLLFVANGYFGPERFSGGFGLLLSVQFIAMILIGGVATVSGSIMGALLIALLPRISSELPSFLPFITTAANKHPNIFEVETAMYGVLIIAFLLFEPRGLFGIWHRIRVYWKSFPFSY